MMMISSPVSWLSFLTLSLCAALAPVFPARPVPRAAIRPSVARLPRGGARWRLDSSATEPEASVSTPASAAPTASAADDDDDDDDDVKDATPVDDFDVSALGGGGGEDDDDDDYDDDDDDDYDEKDLGFDMDALMARLSAEQGPGGFGQFGGAGDPGALAASGTGRNYAWEQTRETMSVSIEVPSDVKAAAISVEFPSPTSIQVLNAGETILHGALGGAVQRDECFWTLDEDDDGRKIIAAELQKASDAQKMWPGFLQSEGDAGLATVTQRAYLDIDVNGTRLGRITLGLFGDDAPKTVDNFKALCDVDDARAPVTYKNCPVHRVIPGFCVQSGDVINGDGTGGTSIYGADAFPDETFQFRHDKPGLLAMANSGPNTNKSQFYITCGQCSWLDKKHVIFGRVLSGMDDVVYKLENLGSTSGDLKHGTEVKIADCGLLDDDDS